MPKVLANGIQMYYEESGSGDPLVFISGLGGNNKLWYLQSLYFKDYYRVITFDNRGVGESDKPQEPYTMAMMARDLSEMLEQLNIHTPVNLVGASMGGLIAQAFIHDYPEKVKKLVLCCTGVSLKDPHFTPAGMDVVEKIFSTTKTKEEYVDNVLSVMYSPEFVLKNPQLKLLMLNPAIAQQPTYAYLNQLNACADDRPYFQWLSQIQVPVFLMHARNDRVFPFQNALTLKEGLKDKGELFVMEQAAHIFFQEKPVEFNEKLHLFLKK